ncbi:MAG: ubiquinol-cytochrome c reductase iron-sulfur subunit [Hydrogenibacillus schlegelii]|nr:ubiquinol-cytochrome c reductase iron-sulfur subunit [Hydrogenibacillus schlegelii]
MAESASQPHSRPSDVAGGREGEITRRQFLTYTLMGTGGFMASMLLVPPLRMAVDPLLKAGEEKPFVPVADANEITDQPKRFEFTLKINDAWVKNQATTYSAWVYKQGAEIVALSPICKHLGCTVNWNASPEHPNMFYCPCHGGLYTKDGINVPGTPPRAPLDLYEVKVEGGKLYLGPLIQRT